MLFSVKNRFWPTLATLVGLAAIGLAGYGSVPWDLAPSVERMLQAALGLAAVLASDALCHGLLALSFRERYLSRYRALAEYFSPQGPKEILAGGLLAGLGEEMFFRGLILQSLLSRFAVGHAAAIAISALLFGACHAIPDRRLAPFALWAVWEGALLGGVYVVTGSLLVVMGVHAAHDIFGFALFALQRRTGWLMGKA